MWKNRNTTLIVTLGFICFGFAYYWHAEQKIAKLNELASSMALDLYYISKDIDDKKFDEARKKLSKSIEITNQIKSENHYDGPYWKMYDRLVNGTIEGVQQSHQPSAK